MGGKFINNLTRNSNREQTRHVKQQTKTGQDSILHKEIWLKSTKTLGHTEKIV